MLIGPKTTAQPVSRSNIEMMNYVPFEFLPSISISRCPNRGSEVHRERSWASITLKIAFNQKYQAQIQMLTAPQCTVVVISKLLRLTTCRAPPEQSCGKILVLHRSTNTDNHNKRPRLPGTKHEHNPVTIAKQETSPQQVDAVQYLQQTSLYSIIPHTTPRCTCVTQAPMQTATPPTIPQYTNPSVF